jgi:hypothetical protein
LAAEELRTYEEIRRIGGDSGWLRSIPWTGKKRAALQSFLARRRGWGRHRTVTLGGSHGGEALVPVLETCTGEREEERPGREREMKRRRGPSRGVAGISRRSSSVSRQAGGGEASTRELHAAASLCWR